MNWYILQLKPNSYNIARINLNRQEFNVFLPMLNVTRRVARKYVERTEPLFPGYMFIEFDIREDLWRKVSSTLGVARIVSLAGKPTPVPTDIVNELMSRCDDDDTLRPLDDIQKGEDVKLVRGPFASFLAKVEEISPDQRIWLLLDILGQSSRVSVDLSAIRRIC